MAFCNADEVLNKGKQVTEALPIKTLFVFVRGCEGVMYSSLKPTVKQPFADSNSSSNTQVLGDGC